MHVTLKRSMHCAELWPQAQRCVAAGLRSAGLIASHARTCIEG